MLALDRSRTAGLVVAQDDEFDDGYEEFGEDDEYDGEDEDEADDEYEEYEEYAEKWEAEPKRGGRHDDDEWD